jgi:hypothetical protein
VGARTGESGWERQRCLEDIFKWFIPSKKFKNGNKTPNPYRKEEW